MITTILCVVQEQINFIHDLELVVLCNNQKITIKELPIKWTHIPNGKLNLFKDSIKMFIGIFRLKIKFKI